MKIIKHGKAIDTMQLEKDSVTGETEIKKIEPRKFIPGQKVTTRLKTDGKVQIPEGIILTISQVVGENMYNLLGPNGLVVTLGGAYLEIPKEG